MLFFALLLCSVLALNTALPCGLEQQCGGGCVKTCRNTCQCEKIVPQKCLTEPYNARSLLYQQCSINQQVWYGGKCMDSDFCSSEFLHLEDCIEEGGASCPKMVDVPTMLKLFTQYDVRIDVRGIGEWDIGHSNISIHTPGLSKMPADNFKDKIGHLTDKNILVYCNSGGRAFRASLNLLRYGFSNVNSYWAMGFPYIDEQVTKESMDSPHHPTKNYCYINGASNICPQPIPFSHISSLGDIIDAVGGPFQFVDVRPNSHYQRGSLPSAINVPAGASHHKLGDKAASYVVFCMTGHVKQAFSASKKFTANGFKKVYWIDNAGFDELRSLRGIKKL